MNTLPFVVSDRRARAVVMLVVSMIAPAVVTARPDAARLAPCSAQAPESPDATRARAAAAFGRLPASFEPNVGQAPADVRFVARGAAAALTATGAVLKAGPEPVTLTFVGASPSARAVASDALPGTANYLHGDDPARWRTNVPTYASVRYERFYPGIDLVYYGRGEGLEYDVVVAPGADADAVTFELAGAGDALAIDPDGALVAGSLRLERPVAYQVIGGERRLVASRYVLRDANRAGFALGAYDPTLPLVVDPEIGYSFRLAEAGKDIEVSGLAVDATGSAYVAGRFRSAGAGGVLTIEAYVAKLNPEGTALVYSTMIGGSDSDEARDVAVDGDGNAFVTGLTYSGNFPTTAGAFQTTNPQPTRIDAFVTKIGPGGSALVYSSYLGGGEFEIGNEIAVDAAGNAFVTGNTTSSNFPTTAPAQSSRGGSIDAFVTKVNAAGGAKVYSTYLGGSAGDTGAGVTVDVAGNAYVVGGTLSTNFPVTAGVLQTAFGGGDGDAYWAKYDAAGRRVASTYLGGSGFDLADAVAVDAAGNSYLTGETDSANFPLVSPIQSTITGSARDALIAELNPAGTALLFSSFYGGSQFESGHAIALDAAGSVYVVGDTYSSNFPTVDPVQPAFGGGLSDAFVLQLNLEAARGGPGPLVFASYVGDTRAESGVGAGVDASLALYFAFFLADLSTGGDENEEGGVIKVPASDPLPAADVSIAFSVTTQPTDNEYRIFVYMQVRSRTAFCEDEASGVRFSFDVPMGLRFRDAEPTTPGVVVTGRPPQDGNGRVSFEYLRPVSSTSVVKAAVMMYTPFGAPPDDDFVLRAMVRPVAELDCLLADNSQVKNFNPFATYLRGARSVQIQPAQNPAVPPGVMLTGNLAANGSRRGAASRTPGVRGFNVYTSTQPNVQPVAANLLASLPPNQTTFDVSETPAGSYFVVTTVVDAGESAPSNEVGGMLPEVTKLKVSSSKVVAEGTGFASDVQVLFAGLEFSTPPKLKKANTKVTQKGALFTGQSVGAFIAEVLVPGTKVLVLFVNGNGNAVAVEYAK